MFYVQCSNNYLCHLFKKNIRTSFEHDGSYLKTSIYDKVSNSKSKITLVEKRRSKKANANRVVTFIPQTEQVSTIDSDWPEAWHSTGLNTTGLGSGSGFSNFQSRTNGGASLGSFGNNQDPFQSHLLSVGNSAEQQNRHQHCTTHGMFLER